ncbi:hypothetical protein QA646_11780 [Rhizobium sp. CB3090]|uniref:hypothetical protein n=1 Tax=Rhizobium sp. CB3090 TaxID=3039156 RepID=UPI0024B1AA49|nr:hypothetical protein [Rhizobium sp. CB3090]WFU07994.1 hypothetical protein QA646_11780 [Rhizobium sp. CB3090]
MLRLVVTLFLSVTSVNLAIAAERLDEFREAKARLAIPDEPAIIPSFIDKMHFELLLGSLIGDHWIILGGIDKSSDDQLAKACADQNTTFTRLSDYSFAKDYSTWSNQLHDVYIRNWGQLYSVRGDYEKKIGQYPSPNMPQESKARWDSITLSHANSESILLNNSQNVILEVRDGIPMLYGHCRPAAATPLFAEFRQAEKFLESARSKDFQQANRQLLDQIDGKWIILNSIALSEEGQVAKVCDKNFLKLAKTDGYSFVQVRKSSNGDEVRNVYLWRSGLSYNVRQDVDALIRGNHKQDNSTLNELNSADQGYLGVANLDVILLPLSPNVVLEIVNGNERVYGRCES